MATQSRPLVVLAGPINPDGKSLLEREARVVVCDDETEAGLVSVAAEAAGILFRLRPSCTESLMARCPKLKVVGRHGVGLDTVDVPAATRLGVAVVHAPGSNSQAVAEHALMLMLACVKRTLLIDKTTRRGDWGAKRIVGNSELAGKTLGIVGVGNIGRRVAKFAGAIGMRVLGYDKYVPGDEVRRRGAEPVKSFEELLPQVDILTCHTPLTPDEADDQREDARAHEAGGDLRQHLARPRAGRARALRGAHARPRRRRGPRRLGGGAHAGGQPASESGAGRLLLARRRRHARGE